MYSIEGVESVPQEVSISDDPSPTQKVSPPQPSTEVNLIALRRLPNNDERNTIDIVLHRSVQVNEAASAYLGGVAPFNEMLNDLATFD